MNTSTQQEFAPELDPRDFTELKELIGHEVVDKNEVQVGTVDSIWEDSTGEPAFITVKTGWFGLGKTLIVPTISAHVRASDQKIRVPYTEQVLKDAPAFDSEHNIDLATERRIYDYYAQHGLLVPSDEVMAKPTADALPPIPGEETKITGDVLPPIPGTTTVPVAPPPLPTEPVQPANTVSANELPPIPTNTQLPPAHPTGLEENNILLHKEKLIVGKREVAEGGVRLRKVVRSEVASVSVELLHEELVIDRVSVTRPAENPSGAFKEEEIYIPLRREELVVGKETVVSEEIHAGKEAFFEKKDVSDTVRSEDVELVDERAVQKS